jgi:hypothetical protein
MPPRQDPPTRPTTREAIAEAITGAVQYLAGVCNYAKTWDGHGVGTPDSHLGHDLAERSQHRALTDDELHASWALCWKYDRTQLQKVDIILPDQATVVRLFGSDTPPRIERTRGTITLEGDALLVRCPYDPGITEVLRQIRRSHGGAGWSEVGGIKGWRFTIRALSDLKTRLALFGFECWVDESRLPATPEPARQPVPDVRSQPAPSAVRARPEGTIDVQGTLLRVAFPYNEALVARMRSIKIMHGGPGEQNDASGRYWLLRVGALSDLIASFPDFTLTPAAETLRTQQQASWSAWRMPLEDLPSL